VAVCAERAHACCQLARERDAAVLARATHLLEKPATLAEAALASDVFILCLLRTGTNPGGGGLR